MRGVAVRLPANALVAAMQWLLLALLAWQLARLAWALATPLAPLGNAAPGAPASAALLGDFDPFFRLQAPAPQAPAQVTALKLTLFGIRLNEASGRGGAIIAGEDGVQKSYAVGEEVMPGVVLKAVTFDHVTLTRNGADEDLFIDQSAGGTNAASPAGMPGAMPGVATAPPPGAATGGMMPGASGRIGMTLQKLRSEIGFIPRIDNGRVTGLVVRPQGSGAAFRQVGLKEGDIVTQIAGRPVSSPGDFDALSGQLAKGGAISLTVERGAELLPLVIAVDAQ
ncbi:MAG: type II secretory protein PulC [Sphingomonas sp.]|nr:type II secretory protein PulC [Sphingomonas sp.]